MEGTNDSESDDLSSATSLCCSDDEYSPVHGVSHEYHFVNSSIDSDESEDKACGRRQRKAVDYKQLYDVSKLSCLLEKLIKTITSMMV